MRLRTVLVDDERVGRSRLRRMLEKEADIEIVVFGQERLDAGRS